MVRVFKGLLVALLLLVSVLTQGQNVLPSSFAPDSVPAARSSSGGPRLRITAGVWRVAVPVALIGVGYMGCNENFVDEAKEAIQHETREAFPRFLPASTIIRGMRLL